MKSAVVALAPLALAAACASSSHDVEDSPQEFAWEVVSEGVPVEGAQLTITAWPKSGRLFGLYDRPVATTNSSGIVRRTFTAAHCWATVSKAGYASESVVAAPGQPVRVELERELAVRGRVKDDFGRPVAGAALHAESVVSPRSREIWITAVADERGDFVLHGVSAQRGYRGSVWGGGVHGVARFELVPHQQSPLELIVPCEGGLSVSLCMPEGRDTPDPRTWSCRLQVHDTIGWRDAAILRKTVNRDPKRVRVHGLMRGNYRASVRISGIGAGVSNLTRVSDARFEDATVEIHPGRTISGTVVDRDGRPLVPARVSFVRDDDAHVSTNEDGHFVLTDMPLEDTSFFVSAPGFESLEVPLMHGETTVDPIVLVHAKSD